MCFAEVCEIGRLGVQIRFRGDLPYLTRTQSRVQITILAPSYPHTSNERRRTTAGAHTHKLPEPTVQIQALAPLDPPMKSLVLLVILWWFFRVAFKPHQLFCGVAYAFCSVLHFISIVYGWLERGTHLFARCGAFNEPLWKVAHSHTRPLLGSGSFRAYQPQE